MAIAFLATIAAQMGSAWFNSSRSKSHSKRMAELQRAYEEKAAIEGIENARAEFAELCAFQREIEKQTHKDRLELIKNNHEQTLYQVAYERSLHKWPLLVPPYVIANAPLTIGAHMEQCIPLNCILTTSSNLSFNRHVFRRIEEKIAIFCSKYWNVSASKSIRFFQEAWKDRANDVGSLHKDIYAHLKSVPTLLISPILKEGTILFRFYWWGLSLDPTDAHVDELNELNPELSISISSDTKFDGEISNLIVEECVPKLEAFISFFADLYYWNFYKEPPTLIKLISSQTIKLPLNDSNQYILEYGNRVIECLDRSKYSIIDSNLIVETTKDISKQNKYTIIDRIHSCVIKNGENLHSLDIPMIKELSQIKSAHTSELIKLIKKLSLDETITIHPFSNAEEMFYNANKLINFPSNKEKVFNLLFINEYAFICSITDENNCNLYSNSASRFHIFITDRAIPLSKYKAGKLNLATQQFYKCDASSSPCNQLSYDRNSIVRLIDAVREFLSSCREAYVQVSPILSDTIVTDAIQENSSYNVLKEWLKNNRTVENEFAVLLTYNSNDKYYVLLGRFFVNGEVQECKAYTQCFKYIDDSIKNLLNYKNTVKINLK